MLWRRLSDLALGMKTAQITSATDIRIPAGEAELEGNLSLPNEAMGLVLFAHGSGSSRFSTRNRHVATALCEVKLGALLFDLLSAREESIDLRTASLRFDIALLAERLMAAMDWTRQKQEVAALPMGLFGASTGAAAALVAAARRPQQVAAVVSRGGRSDLAGSALRAVQAPTLLIVGGNDSQVEELNRRAMAQLRCEKKLEIVPRASHLFEEPGALDQVAKLAGDWFVKKLVTPFPPDMLRPAT